jgi:lantibiotic modifying enzyme
VLYPPEAHEALTERDWDEARVRDAIAGIVADTDEAYAPGELWPADEWDAWDVPTPLSSLYCGASGVVWALDALRRRGLAETSLDLSSVAGEAVEQWRAAPELSPSTPMPAAAEAGFLSGETGILLVAWRLGLPGRLEDDLERRILESRESEADELMWGMPGALVAAQAMLDWTGDARWAAAWNQLADLLWQRRTADGLWVQDLFGRQSRGLGPVHGLVGNVLALLGGSGLAPERRAALVDDATAVLERAAVVEDGLVNWPPSVESSRDKLRLQWCHGAPGIVVSTASYMPEELLLGGAELTWQAGPPGMEKGSGLCHGTAGNGYAFLKAFERTGDDRWLERARQFCMHALEQIERRRHGRYSLFTGDVGVALYAADCLEGRAAYPIVDGWEPPLGRTSPHS